MAENETKDRSPDKIKLNITILKMVIHILVYAGVICLGTYLIMNNAKYNLKINLHVIYCSLISFTIFFLVRVSNILNAYASYYDNIKVTNDIVYQKEQTGATPSQADKALLSNNVTRNVTEKVPEQMNVLKQKSKAILRSMNSLLK